MISDQELRTFVGDNYDYYKSNWEFISFNPFAAIFGPFWFFYRKLNLFAFIIIFLNSIFIFFYFSSDLEDLPLIDVIRLNNFWFFVFLFFSLLINGTIANSLYKFYTYSKIKYLKKIYFSDDYLQVLSKEGGTSLSFLFYVFIFFIWLLIFGAIAFLAFTNFSYSS